MSQTTNKPTEGGVFVQSTIAPLGPRTADGGYVVGRKVIRADATVAMTAVATFRAFVERAGGRMLSETERAGNRVRVIGEIPWTDSATCVQIARAFEAAFGMAP